MTRRGLIGALLGAATMDPERLLWVPGAKVISIPKPVVARHTMYVRKPMRFSPIAGCIPINNQINAMNTGMVEITETWWRFRA